MKKTEPANPATWATLRDHVPAVSRGELQPLSSAQRQELRPGLLARMKATGPDVPTDDAVADAILYVAISRREILPELTSAAALDQVLGELSVR